MHAHAACTKVRLKPLNGGAKHDLISRKTISSAKHCDNVPRVKRDERRRARITTRLYATGTRSLCNAR